MKKILVKMFTVVLTLVVISACTVTSFAQSATTKTYDDYIAVNTDQKDYYNNVYRGVFDQYLQTLRNFRVSIQNTNFETAEQAQRVINFLKNLVNAHNDFYGDRTTVGKSRYEVPFYRNAMYKAADEDKDYDTAIQLCNKLKSEVIKRVEFMQDVMSKIDGYKIIETEEDDILAYAKALIDSVAAMDKCNTDHIDSQAQIYSGSHSAIVATNMTALGFNPQKYSWSVKLAYKGSKNVSSVIISTSDISGAVTNVPAYNYKNSALLKGTSSITSQDYKTLANKDVTYNILKNFTVA